MSDLLLNVDLTSAVVGTDGFIMLPTISVQGPSDLAHLRFFNESGCGIQIQFNDGTSDLVPAGAWPIYALQQNVTRVDWVVAYVIPNAPISTLQPVYYYPGEPLPENVVLGNSPIGITGAVTTGGSTLSNEGNAAPTEVIDIGTVANAKLVDIFNDHFLWAVEQAGIKHSVLAGNSSGNPLTIGQAGDIAEALGELLVNQLLDAAGGISVTGTTVVPTLDPSGNLDINIPSGRTFYVNIGGVDTFAVNSVGPKLEIGQYQFLAGTLSRFNGHRTTCGGGTTISHGLGVTPTASVGCPDIAQAGSATVGTGNNNSTSFQATVGSGSSIGWIAFAL